MKKILAIGVLTICSIAFTQQQASAWINSRFGIGMNWDYQSGGNNFLWGAWRNGQPNGMDPVGGPLKTYCSQTYGMPAQPIPQPHAPHAPHHTPAPGYGPGAFTPSGAASTPTAAYPGYNYGMPYQFATYPRPTYFYPTPYSR